MSDKKYTLEILVTISIFLVVVFFWNVSMTFSIENLQEQNAVLVQQVEEHENALEENSKEIEALWAEIDRLAGNPASEPMDLGGDAHLVNPSNMVVPESLQP